MENKLLRLAVIGGGAGSAVGDAHRIACQMDGRWKPICGAFSSNHERNVKSSLDWGVAPSRTYLHWKKLLEMEASNIDAAVVLTPTPSHFEIVKMALHYNIPVICEKALTCTAAESKKIKSLVDSQKAFLCAVFNYTGYAMIRELRRIVVSGELGHISQINIQMPQEGFARLNKEGGVCQPQEWRLKDGDLPTIALDLGTHVIHLIRFITGGVRPLELVGVYNSCGHFTDVIDNVLGIIKYDNKIIAQAWFSKSALGHLNDLKIEVYGNKGSVRWKHSMPEQLEVADVYGGCRTVRASSVECLIASKKRYQRFKAGHPAGFIEAFANHYSDIADALSAFKAKEEFRSEFVFGCDDAIEGLLVLEAFQRSVITRSWQSVNC